MSQSNYRPRPQQRPPYRPGQPAARPGAYPRQGRPAPARRPAFRPYTGRKLPYGLGRLVIVGILAIALAFALQCAWPNGFPVATKQNTGTAKQVVTIQELHSNGPIRINEIMTGNQTVLSIADGSTPDWIEIANTSGAAVNLAGYQLSKSANASTVFTFPEIWLNAGECIVVHADSKLRETAGEDLHAPFRLSSSGDTLLLFNADDTAIDTVNIPALARNSSYARMGKTQWQQSTMPTPGLPNTEDSYRALNEPVGNSPIGITEVMSTNTKFYADENGQYYDYVELYNHSGEAVNLDGWFLSDDSTKLRKWSFPEVIIQPGEYLVIHASKLDRKDDPAHLHTNFSLSSEGEEVVLSNELGKELCRVEFGLLKADIAWALGSDGTWAQAAMPSPGRAN